MKKRLLLVCLVVFLMKNTYAIQEEMIENDDGIYVETVASTEIPNINARAAILYDVTYDRVLYEKNAKQKRANASTTKMLTALVAIEDNRRDALVTVSQKAAKTGGSSIQLKEGDQVTLHDLIKGLLVHSGNDAAVAIAEFVAGNVEEFAVLMNEKAEEIGARDTNFVTPHGLDEENHYSTAYDLMLIAKELLNNPLLAEIVSQKMITITVNQQTRQLQTTNEMLTLYEGANGVKTGFTGDAGRCIITSVEQQGRQLICVVLGCDSKKNRTIDSIRLLDYGFQKFQTVDLKGLLRENLFITVEKSKGGIYKIQPIESFYYPLKEDEKEAIEIEYHMIPHAMAPLSKGTSLGVAQIRLKGGIIKEIEYVLPQKIERKTWQDYWKNIFFESIKKYG